jgi:hypothetical protein
MIAISSPLTLLLLIPLVLTSASLRGGESADKDRELVSTGKEVCARSILWQNAGDGYRHPTVPCLTHKACNSFTDVGPGWQACCLVKDCVCGTTQSMFVPGVLHCARFTCTANSDCSPGLCISGQCSFANIKPHCTSNSCGTNQVCQNGMCYYKDPVTKATYPVGGDGFGGGANPFNAAPGTYPTTTTATTTAKSPAKSPATTPAMSPVKKPATGGTTPVKKPNGGKN